jgi:hypothetical protein
LRFDVTVKNLAVVDVLDCQSRLDEPIDDLPAGVAEVHSTSEGQSKAQSVN